LSDRSDPLRSGAAVTLSRDDVPQIVHVLCDAFHDYPVMRLVLGTTAGPSDSRLRRLIAFFVMARALRDEPMLGVYSGSTLAAAAIASYPDRPVHPPELDTLREAVWRELGSAERERYEACGRVWQSLAVDVPHIHLNMIGVRGSAQGRGLGRLLLDRVHRLSGETPGSMGVTLTTEDPANVPLYERAGYEIVGHAPLAPDVETWSFFRPD
jgi:GNAT superfamily N-acetyltransferase